MRVPSIIAVTLGFGHSVLGQDLATALSKYPEASTFQSFIGQVPNGGIASLIPTGISPNSTEGVTVLVPTNAAFQKFLNTTNATSITDLRFTALLPILKYHIMYAKLTSSNFSAQSGLIVPTVLQDEEYNNRSAGADLINTYGQQAANGAPLYVSHDPINPFKFRIRQSQNGGVALRGGQGQVGSINAVDGQWDLGYFQLVDTVLNPPAPCSKTINGQSSLNSLGVALTNTNLWHTLDTAANVTCLAPSNDAFTAAGNPQDSLSGKDLTSALLFHTLPQPYYSPYLTDGMVITSMANTSVTVRLIGDDVYFNDAKVISPNVLTNNGLIHVLDKVMSPNGTAPGTSTPTSTGTGTATPTGTGGASSTPSSTNGAGLMVGSNWGLLAFMGAAAVLV